MKKTDKKIAKNDENFAQNQPTNSSNSNLAQNPAQISSNSNLIQNPAQISLNSNLVRGGKNPREMKSKNPHKNPPQSAENFSQNQRENPVQISSNSNLTRGGKNLRESLNKTKTAPATQPAATPVTPTAPNSNLTPAAKIVAPPAATPATTPVTPPVTTPALAQKLAALPAAPGVYRFYNSRGELLYVGKAKSLKNRVRSYFRGDLPSPRIAKMVSQIADLQLVVTASEADALILENSLIKSLKPHYNILLRDDKTYPYIAVDFAAPFARPVITRKVQRGKNVRYFGPFYRGAGEILEAVFEQFALVQKGSCLREKKACLFAQIGRCHAPCEGKISREDYAGILAAAMKSVKNPALLLPAMRSQMARAAVDENFERAAALRDKIRAIEAAGASAVQIDLARLEDFDAYAVAALAGSSCVVRLCVRGGRVSGVKQSFCAGEDAAGLYKQAILSDYKAQIPLAASKIYTLDAFEDIGVVGEILAARFGKKIELRAAKIGEKRRICEVARQNALVSLREQIGDKHAAFLAEFGAFFGLGGAPRKIEVFDNSQLFGEAVVGGMVVWEREFGGAGERNSNLASENVENSATNLAANSAINLFGENGENAPNTGGENAPSSRSRRVFGGVWRKELYRHFHLRGASDYEQMSEVLTRRARAFGEVSPPDVWVIDGGEALVRLAQRVIASSGANVVVVGIAKEKIDAKAHRAKGRARDKIWARMRGGGGVGGENFDGDFAADGGAENCLASADGGANSAIASAAQSAERGNPNSNLNFDKLGAQNGAGENFVAGSDGGDFAAGAGEVCEVRLSDGDEKLLFLQALRDEAHRFAISFHRATRERRGLGASRLAKLGVSQAAAKKLLDFFGTFEGVFAADFGDLCAVCGKKTAEKIAAAREQTP